MVLQMTRLLELPKPRIERSFFFVLSGFSFTGTYDSQDSRGREVTIFYSTLPIPPAHEHWDIYLQLCMWDDYHVFLIATLAFTRLLLDENSHLIELPCNVCLSTWWIYSRFLLQRFDMGTSGLELASTITLVLQENRLTKCAIPPKIWRHIWVKYDVIFCHHNIAMAILKQFFALTHLVP